MLLAEAAEVYLREPAKRRCEKSAIHWDVAIGRVLSDEMPCPGWKRKSINDKDN